MHHTIYITDYNQNQLSSTPSIVITTNKTMVLSEGGREVLEAARKRLATAKSQATAATQMLVHAQSMSDTANKEVKEARTALEEVEKKYEVIDVDGDDLNPNEGSNKRRKVSLSPQNNYDSTARNNISADQTIIVHGCWFQVARQAVLIV